MHARDRERQIEKERERQKARERQRGGHTLLFTVNRDRPFRYRKLSHHLTEIA